MTDRPIIIIGAGGHLKVIIDVTRLLGYEILFATDIDASLHGTTIMGVKIAGDDDSISAFNPSDVYLANGVGIVNGTGPRRQIFEEWAASGYQFPPLLHPNAVVADTIIIEEGVQCMAGSIVQPGVRLGKNSIINNRAGIDHDVRIGNHTFIGPGVSIGGNVVIHDDAFIGANAFISQNISIGERSIIGAGSIVIRSLDADSKAVGNPARLLEKKS